MGLVSPPSLERMMKYFARAPASVFDIARRLPKYGLDQKISRKTWKDNSFWTIHRIRVKPDGRHGTAFGTLTWRGVETEGPKRIHGVHKQVWRHIPGLPMKWKSFPKPPLEQDAIEKPQDHIQ